MKGSYFSVDTFVSTKSGNIPISTIRPGMQVLSHLNNWCKVIECNRATLPTITIKGHGQLTCTPESKLLVIPEFPSNIIDFDSVLNLNKGYWATPKFEETIKSNELSYDNNLLWIIGKYIRSGWISSGKNIKKGWIAFSCNEKQYNSMESHIRQMTDTYHYNRLGNSYTFYSYHKPIAELLSREFGSTKQTKRIHSWVLNLPEDKLKILFNGIIDISWIHPDSGLKFSTINKSLALSVRQIAEILGYSTKIHINHPKNSKHHTYYNVFLQNRKNSDTITFNRYDKNYAWYKIGKITENPSTTVFNIKVEDDHSFIADSIVVHD